MQRKNKVHGYKMQKKKKKTVVENIIVTRLFASVKECRVLTSYKFWPIFTRYKKDIYRIQILISNNYCKFLTDLHIEWLLSQILWLTTVWLDAPNLHISSSFIKIKHHFDTWNNVFFFLTKQNSHHFDTSIA